ncbi:hypothetical protein IGI04_013082 [Brassica rapa subsp. trilocularis]|uniref:RNase H type-1 domain-containing protein n=1 Tax=Brassica rapa subsp. trilocularis TaxID=1813537 RepID=A0ABQ7N8E2_BRACM|nr:hypothetical protein IGI04_013082 [Brassica rapa subsp. trilocularis]
MFSYENFKITAYKLLSVVHEQNNPAHRSLPPVEQQLWKNLWKLKTLPKIRHFLLRVLSGAIAVKERLRSRNLGTDTTCKTCGQGPETVCHLLFTCPAAVEACKIAQIPPPRGGFSPNSTFLNLHYLVACTKKRNAELGNFKTFPWILWNLWKSRNSLVFENSRSSDFSCVTKSVEEANIWFQVNNDTCVPSHDIAQPLPLSDHWVRPPMGLLKCNIGSAWDHLWGLIGTGWLLRDRQGTPINHSRRAFSESTSRREADLNSLLWAVESMVNMRLKNVILEASSIELREALLEPHQYPELKSLIERILLLFSRLDSWSLIHVQGSRNRVATAIAVSVITDVRTQSYVATGGPSWLSHTILSEAQAV